MSNSWYKQGYVQGFDCETISFKNAENIFNVWKFLRVFMKVW